MNNELSQVIEAVSASPILAPFIENWRRIDLPECWLVAGALAQTVWNKRFSMEPGYGLADIDIVYFDGSDLSERAEARHAARIRAAFSDVPAWIDVKNQARVHLWYGDRFGFDIEPYDSVSEAITTFPTTATALGLRPKAGGYDLDAPFGLSDLVNGVVRANKMQASREVYEDKAERWKALWPELTVIDWDG